MRNRWTTVLGFVVAPLAAGVVAVLWVPYFGWTESASSVAVLRWVPHVGWTSAPPPMLWVIVDTAILSIIVAYVSALLLGLPLFLTLRFFRYDSLMVYALSGFLLGLFVFELCGPGWVRTLLGPLSKSYELFAGLLGWTARFELPCGIAGLTSAMVFWWIVRPDSPRESTVALP